MPYSYLIPSVIVQKHVLGVHNITGRFLSHKDVNIDGYFITFRNN